MIASRRHARLLAPSQRLGLPGRSVRAIIPVVNTQVARGVSRSLGVEQRLFPANDWLADCIGLAWLTLVEVVHDVEHQGFHDRPQHACSGASCLGPPRDFSDRVVIESQSGAVVAEQDFVLPGERVSGLGQDSRTGLPR